MTSRSRILLDFDHLYDQIHFASGELVWVRVNAEEKMTPSRQRNIRWHSKRANETLERLLKELRAMDPDKQTDEEYDKEMRELFEAGKEDEAWEKFASGRKRRQ